ncbi:MAG: hypothetical protein NXI04_20290 [Planctomycetaceae bacterium]|nr:hypothetical protein [Planctomycetaceae bacterium]
MPKYRYEAVDSKGVPIHGVVDAPDHDALIDYVKSKEYRLVSSSEVSLDSLVAANRNVIPRLFQLRMGEQLRESLLIGLPAHSAVRALAAEPVSHAVPGMMPWLMGTSWILFLLAQFCAYLTGDWGTAVVATGVMAVVVTPTLTGIVRWMYDVRPRRIMRGLARQLESGDDVRSATTTLMPKEIRAVMSSPISDEHKARVAAELVPSLMNGNLRVQQFVMTLVGPAVLLSIVMIGIYSVMLFIIPRFKSIFEDFGTELPVMTEMVIRISDLFAWTGITGWVVVTVATVVAVLMLSLLLASHRGAELFERIPVFGVAFRWAMQARVARVISAMVRNGCSYSDSIRVATAGSGFRAVSQQGDRLAARLDAGDRPDTAVALLSGLPMSMLYVSASGSAGEHRRAVVADTFSGLAEMLDTATVGQGRLFAMVVQFSTVTVIGLTVAFSVIALFLPLIKLLNDLS